MAVTVLALTQAASLASAQTAKLLARRLWMHVAEGRRITRFVVSEVQVLIALAHPLSTASAATAPAQKRIVTCRFGITPAGLKRLRHDLLRTRSQHTLSRVARLVVRSASLHELRSDALRAPRTLEARRLMHRELSMCNTDRNLVGSFEKAPTRQLGRTGMAGIASWLGVTPAAPLHKSTIETGIPEVMDLLTTLFSHALSTRSRITVSAGDSSTRSARSQSCLEHSLAVRLWTGLHLRSPWMKSRLAVSGGTVRFTKRSHSKKPPMEPRNPYAVKAHAYGESACLLEISSHVCCGIGPSNLAIFVNVRRPRCSSVMSSTIGSSTMSSSG